MWQKKKKKTETKKDLRLLFGQGFNHIYIHTHSICQRISDFKFNEARSPLFLSLVESSFTFTWGYTIQGE
jgi:hypothetical protein